MLVACQNDLDKQCIPRSDCFWRSSLILVGTVCFSDKHFGNTGSDKGHNFVELSGPVDRAIRLWIKETHQSHCLVSLSKKFFPLLSTGLPQEDTKSSWHYWKIVDWDVKHRHKQTNQHFIWEHKEKRVWNFRTVTVYMCFWLTLYILSDS